MSGYLFMGVQPDPEMDVLAGRGDVRIYDGSRPAPSDRPNAPPSGKRGAYYLPGGSTCICGGCWMETRCPAEGPREAHHVRLWTETARSSSG